LDVGSNSAQLQVVDARCGAPPLPVYAVKAPTLLGESFDATGSIDQPGIDRTVTAVGEAMKAARRIGVDELYFFVTAAVRDAANREIVLDRLEGACGARPQYLTGEDEARLTYLAAHLWYGWAAGRMLMIDIGGGSMEIALGRDTEPDLTLSVPLGAGRLTRDFLADDPPSPRQLKALRQQVNATLREVGDRLRWEGPPHKAVATSKTFKQLARLAGSPPQRSGPFVRRTLTTKDLAEWIPRLARLRADERAGLRGVSRPRARQIIAGAVVARAAMKALGLSSVEVSPWALREGIVMHHLQAHMNHSPAMPLRPFHNVDEGADILSLEAKRNEQGGGLP
jgi:exopolyphosphatase/guanosine-5'-triphosphate,3'-diphosphate pyrophosphatase